MSLYNSHKAGNFVYLLIYIVNSWIVIVSYLFCGGGVGVTIGVRSA